MSYIATVTKANWAEKTLLNNFAWAFLQRKYIMPIWKESVLLREGSRVAEVGCGRGAGAILILREFNPESVEAFDLDEGMVEKARSYTQGYESRISVDVGDVPRIDAPDGRYDAVFDSFTLHHVEDWRKGISEISRVLRPGGYFAFAELYNSAVSNYMMDRVLHHPLEERFDRQELVRSLAENGLRLMERKVTLPGGWGLIGVTCKG